MDARATSAVPVAHCLIIDDEKELAGIVADYLTREGFAVQTATDGEAALELARRDNPDVIILDLMLPGIDGVEVCRRLRTFSDSYVIMLTARSDEIDKLIGLSVGADDYLTKPFSPRELVARVKVMLRRPRTTDDAGGSTGPADEQHAIRRFGSLAIDPGAREVLLAGEAVELTRTEFDLLAAMSAQPRLAFTRRQLIAVVWGGDWFGDDHLVDVHIAHLRRKLGDDAADPRFIRTVRGIGYGMGQGK